MGTEEHLAILKQGVKVWNAWKRENPDIRPYLFKANLRGADLSGANLDAANLLAANLSEANLSGAYLSGAYLSGVYLNRASLIGAYLIGANLNGANLIGANLDGANLLAANLSGANLSGANLNGANLNGANLNGATCGYTVFGDIDLSQVIGLETIRHFGPSTIGIDTLYKSQGNIPEAFLRGCGVPKDFMAAVSDIVGVPPQFDSCFISHSREDRAFAECLDDALFEHAISCWRYEKSMKQDASIHAEIDRGIRDKQRVLLCCSRTSMNSWWIRGEIELALLKEQELYPNNPESPNILIALDLDGYIFGDGRDTWMSRKIRASSNVIDFKGWEHDNTIFECGIESVLKVLRIDGSKESPPKQNL